MFAKKVAMMLPHHPARISLELLHHLNNTMLPCFLQKHVNVVWATFKSTNIQLQLVRCLDEVGSGQFSREVILKDRSPIRWRELEVPVRFSHAVRTRSIDSHILTLRKVVKESDCSHYIEQSSSQPASGWHFFFNAWTEKGYGLGSFRIQSPDWSPARVSAEPCTKCRKFISNYFLSIMWDGVCF